MVADRKEGIDAGSRARTLADCQFLIFTMDTCPTIRSLLPKPGASESSISGAYMREGQLLAFTYASTSSPFWILRIVARTAAVIVNPSHGQPCARVHTNTSRCPSQAARAHVNSSHGQPCPRKHLQVPPPSGTSELQNPVYPVSTSRIRCVQKCSCLSETLRVDDDIPRQQARDFHLIFEQFR